MGHPRPRQGRGVSRTRLDRNEDLMDVTVNKAKDGQSATIRFAKWGVKRNYRVKIEAVV